MFRNLDIPTLSDKVRLLSDKRQSEYVTDQEIENLLDDSFKMLYMELVELDQNYFLKQVEDITPINGNEIIFPDDLYKVKHLEHTSGEYSYSIYPKALDEVSGVSGPFWDAYGIQNIYGYVLFPNSLKLYPAESASGLRFRLSYLVDPLNVGNSSLQTAFEKFLTYKCAYTITCMEQNPNTSLADLAKEWQEKVIMFASQRSKGPRVIKDLETRHQGIFGSIY